VSIPFLPNQTKNKCTDLFGMPSQKRRVLFLFPQDDKNEINVFDSLFFFAKQKNTTLKLNETELMKLKQNTLQ